MMKALISTILFAVATVGSLSWAQEQKELIKPALSVSIRSARSTYSIKENLRLEIQLENVGGESVLVCRNWAWGFGRTDVRVLDSNGKDIFTTFLAEELPPPPGVEDFLELRSGEFFGIRLNESAAH